MAKEKVTAVVDKIENTTDATSEKLQAAKGWLVSNSKKIMLYGGIVIVAALGYIGYKNYYVGPKENTANEALAIAEDYFKKDSLKIALDGDGKNAGFSKIITKHSGTKASNLANYYAALCEMKLASVDSTKDDKAKAVSYEKAAKYLKSFEANGAQQFSAKKYELLGDLYAEMKNNKEAITNYEESASIGEIAIAPMALYKAALLSEATGDSKKAGEFYKEICEKYSNPESKEYKLALKGAAKNGIIIDK